MPSRLEGIETNPDVSAAADGKIESQAPPSPKARVPEPIHESMIDLMGGCIGSPDSDEKKQRRKKTAPKAKDSQEYKARMTEACTN